MRAAAPAFPSPPSVSALRSDERARIAVPFVGRLLAVLTFGACLGLAATEIVLDRGIGIGVSHAGPWGYRPQVGTKDIDPYGKAVFAREGRIPMPAGEGLMFEARTDDAGRILDRKCSYTVAGPVPASRLWTISVHAPTGAVLENEARRFGFNSSEVLRRTDGSFTMELASEARPGNWLPLSGTGAFVIALRLYETPLSAARIESSGATFPVITRQGCSGT